MKNLIISVTVLLSVTMFVSSCGNSTAESKEKNEQTENAMYQCPMKCEGDKMYDKPGQCPVCKMDLKKMDATHEH